jgi:hypothetical protein
MFSLIVACALYLYPCIPDHEEAGHFPTPETVDDVSDNELSEEESVHSCRSTDDNIFVLDLTFSEIPLTPFAFDIDVAHTLLEALFTQCTCRENGDTAGAKYQWTLVIDELNYAKTKGNTHCTGSQKSCQSSNRVSATAKNATVGKVYVKKAESLIQKRLECVLETVNCALLDVDKELHSDTCIQVILASQLERE